MDPNNAERIFWEASQIESDSQREEYLDQECASDDRLRKKVDLLLAARHDAEDFLESPPSDLANGIVTLDQPVTEKPGDMIAGYKLLQEVGEGGMGVVFMAEQKQPVKRRVALKIIKPGMDSRQVIARFEAERQALAMMDHPNIAKVLDCGTTDAGRPYFVMELVKGVPITKYCDENHLTARERLELFIPVCQAIQHAHQKGIIHRDIKPSNILIAEYDHTAVPKIIDFGVAKALNTQLTDKTMFTQLGQIIGTIEYMSPEQAKVNQMDVDTRSDVYSLGVVLYELLTGATPFDKTRLRSAALDELMRIIREEEPPRPSTRLSTIDTLPSVAANRKIEPRKLSLLLHGELDWIVMKALEKDRGRRYDTASAFAADVKHYLDDDPVVACPPSAAYRFRKFARRNKVALFTCGIVAAALVVGIVGTSWQAIRATFAEKQLSASLEDVKQQRDRAVTAEDLAKDRLTVVEQQKNEIAGERDRATKAEQNAKEEAAIAKAVNDFLQNDLLGMADVALQYESDMVPDPNIKLATLLDRALASIDERFGDQPRIRAEIQSTLASALRAIGRYEDALSLFQNSSTYFNENLGREHPRTLTSMNRVANAYSSLGKYDKALELQKQTVQLRRRVLGPEHSDTLQSMNHLAAFYQYTGQFDQSVKLYEPIVVQNKKILGPEHPDTLSSMNNLAEAYRDAGQNKKAHELSSQTVELTRRIFGPEHPNTLVSMNNLALAYSAMGEYQNALELIKQILELRTKVSGSEHPDTLNSMGNLAAVYQSLGNYDASFELHKKAFDLRHKILGPEHPRTLLSMTHLAGAYRSTGQIERAIELFEQTLQLTRKVLGPEHPQTLTTMGSLAERYSETGQNKKAIELLEQTLQLSRKVLGPEHPQTLTIMGALAEAYRVGGQNTKALELNKQTFELQRDILGPEHLSTLRTMNNLALTYRNAGQFNRAIELFEQTLFQFRKALGPEHPETLVSTANLANAFWVAGKHDGAIELLEQTLIQYKKVFGPEHLKTLSFMNILGGTYRSQGKDADYESLHREALEISQRILGEEDPSTLNSMMELAFFYQTKNRFDEAQILIDQFFPIQQNKLPKDSPKWTSVLIIASINNIETKQFAEAETQLRECLAIREKKMPESWLVDNTKAMLGLALLSQQKYAEAEPLLTEGYAGLQRQKDKIPEFVREAHMRRALEGLVTLYKTRKDDVDSDQLEKYQELLEALPAKEESIEGK